MYATGNLKSPIVNWFTDVFSLSYVLSSILGCITFNIVFPIIILLSFFSSPVYIFSVYCKGTLSSKLYHTFPNIVPLAWIYSLPTSASSPAAIITSPLINNAPFFTTSPDCTIGVPASVVILCITLSFFAIKSLGVTLSIISGCGIASTIFTNAFVPFMDTLTHEISGNVSSNFCVTSSVCIFHFNFPADIPTFSHAVNISSFAMRSFPSISIVHTKEDNVYNAATKKRIPKANIFLFLYFLINAGNPHRRTIWYWHPVFSAHSFKREYPFEETFICIELPFGCIFHK